MVSSALSVNPRACELILIFELLSGTPLLYSHRHGYLCNTVLLYGYEIVFRVWVEYLQENRRGYQNAE